MFVGALIFLLNCIKYNIGVVGNLLYDFLLASLFFFLLDLIIYNLLFCKQSTEIRIPLADNKNTPILKNHCQKKYKNTLQFNDLKHLNRFIYIVAFFYCFIVLALELEHCQIFTHTINT